MPAPRKYRTLPAVCEKCGAAMRPHAPAGDRHCYRCPLCKGYQSGYPALPPPPPREIGFMPCPKCHGRARCKRANDRNNYLFCTVCGHNFTDRYLKSPMMRAAEGRCRYQVTFALSIAATIALDALSQKRGMSLVQAIRYVLREENNRPIHYLTVIKYRRDPLTGDREPVITHNLPEPTPEPRTPLTNQRRPSQLHQLTA